MNFIVCRARWICKQIRTILEQPKNRRLSSRHAGSFKSRQLSIQGVNWIRTMSKYVRILTRLMHGVILTRFKGSVFGVPVPAERAGRICVGAFMVSQCGMCGHAQSPIAHLSGERPV
jgi:hypothetical protein